MKILFIIVSAMSVCLSANAGDSAKKANRKPASKVTGTVQYTGPFSVCEGGVCTPTGPAGPLTINGDAAVAIYNQMTGITADPESGEKAGKGIVCKKIDDTPAGIYCSIDFSDVRKGLIDGCGSN